MTTEAHYVSVFATLTYERVNGFTDICFAMSPLEDETKQEADEHIIFVHFVLSVFGKQWLMFLH